MASYPTILSLVAFALVVMCALLQGASANGSGDKIIIMPHKHHGHHHKVIPIP